MNKKFSLLILLCILLGAGVRSLFLSQQSFWFDEAFTYLMISKDLASAHAAEASKPVVYTVSLYYWALFFGYTEAALRSFSVLCSVISLVLLIPVGRLFLNRHGLLLFIFLVALSPMHVYYAQEARCYALLNCWLLAFVLSLVTFTRTQKWSAAIMTVVFAELALYTHFISVFFIATGFFYAVWQLRKERSALFRLVGMYVAIVLLFTPWLIQMLSTAAAGGQIRKYLFLKLPQTYVSFLFGDTLFPLSQDTMNDLSGFLQDFWLPLLLAAVVSAAFALLIVIDLFTKRKEQSGGALFLFAFMPVALVFLLSFKLMLLDERYVQFSSFFVFALVARTVSLRWHQRPVRVLFAVLILLQSWSIWNYFMDDRFGKEQWREVVQYIEKSATADTLIVFDVGYLDIAYQYYQTRPVESLRAIPNYSEPVEVPFEWEPRLESVDSFILIRSHVEHDLVLDTIQEQFLITEEKYYRNGKGITVYHLKRRNV